jgi:diguanylate cyclase (GGDEF)-like protein
MENYMEQWGVFFSCGLMIVSTLVLLAALVATHKIVAKLPNNKVRRNWIVVRALTSLSITGYICYTAVSWKNGTVDAQSDAQSIGYYVAPFTYLLCAGIVYLITSFVLNSAIYVKQFDTGELDNITDPLMGIYNRRHLDSRLQQEVKRSLRYKLPLSVLLLSLENIKDIVDARGQQATDSVLSKLGTLVLNSARTTDIVARYDEAEILVVATNTPVSGLSILANRLSKTITDTFQFPKEEVTEFAKEKKVAAVTSSIGIAGLGGETTTVETLVKCVEDALSQARAKGRNMVIANQSDPLNS